MKKQLLSAVICTAIIDCYLVKDLDGSEPECRIPKMNVIPEAGSINKRFLCTSKVAQPFDICIGFH